MTPKTPAAGMLTAEQIEEFYRGILAALAVVAAHDQPTIASDIVNTVEKKKLFVYADAYDRKILAKLGIKK